MFRDDRGSRRSPANAYDQLLPEAVRLAAGRDIPLRFTLVKLRAAATLESSSRMAGSESTSLFSDNLFRHSSGRTRLSPDTIRT